MGLPKAEKCICMTPPIANAGNILALQSAVSAWSCGVIEVTDSKKDEDSKQFLELAFCHGTL